MPVGLSARGVSGDQGRGRAGRADGGAGRRGAAEGQTGRGPGPARPARSSVAGSPCRGERLPRGLQPRPLPGAADEAGPPVWPERRGAVSEGDPFSLGRLQLLVARWCPWQMGLG